MSMSIRTRMLLTVNLLVIGVGVLVGWLAIAVATGDIERNLIDEPLTQAARLFAEGDLPRTDASLLGRMGRVLGAEMATGTVDGRGVVASSLTGQDETRLARQLHGLPLADRVWLGAQAYRVASTVLSAPADTTHREAMRLYLLVPESRVVGAKDRVRRTIALLTLAAVAVATLASAWLSHTITRPLRRLTRRMDCLSRAAADVDLDALLAAESDGPGRGRAEQSAPAEVERLTACYGHLIKQLADARARLAHSARLATLGQVSASIAHELRNPLSGIKMNARVLADEMTKVGLDDASMKLIVREIDRMDVCLQELLGLAAETAPGASGQGAPGEPLHTEPIRLDEVADSVVSLLAERCRRSGVSVERRDGGAVTVVRADPGRVRQVILNLMLNALDAMPDGGTIKLSADATGGGGVRFSVADTGGGVQMPPGTDIFEPFTSGKAGGTGLGLHVCRRIIRRHDGEMGYTSSAEGSTFWFELPGGAE